jgi:hypothetical protein
MLEHTVTATCRPEEVIIQSRLGTGECGEVQPMADDGDGFAWMPAAADRRQKYMRRWGDPQTSWRSTAKLYGGTGDNGSTLRNRAS